MIKITGNEPINGLIEDGTSYSERALNGLTKREYFAIVAMQGLLSASSIGNCSHFATRAVAMADALIAELNKQP